MSKILKTISVKDIKKIPVVCQQAKETSLGNIFISTVMSENNTKSVQQ
jgi:hypothetical protein